MDDPVTDDDSTSNSKSSRGKASSPRDFISAWEAVNLLAFNSTESPEGMGLRSFNQGNLMCPDETVDAHAARVALNDRFDAAEHKFFCVAALKKFEVTGIRRIKGPQGYWIPQVGTDPMRIPPDMFRNRQLAISPEGDLVARLDTLETLFPNFAVLNSDADPRIPVYYDLQISLEEFLAMLKSESLLQNGDEQDIVGTSMILKTGAPGRPSSMHLVKMEYRRRKTERTSNTIVAAEARALQQWLEDKYPEAAIPQIKSITNSISKWRRSDSAQI